MATTLTTPTIDGSALSGVSVQLTGLTDVHAVSWDMRYGTGSNLNNAFVNIVTPNANGVVEITGLNAATNYYFQVRAVGDGTNYLTSAWSNTKLIKTGNLWPEIVVQNLNDSGEGSLRKALNDIAQGGTITFDRSLSGGTIYLRSSITGSRVCVVDASSLESKLIIDGGERQRDNNGWYAHFGSAVVRGIHFTRLANHGSWVNLVAAGTLDDCVIDNCYLSGDTFYGGMVQDVTLIGCVIKNNDINNNGQPAVSSCSVYNCIVVDNTVDAGGPNVGGGTLKIVNSTVGTIRGGATTYVYNSFYKDGGWTGFTGASNNVIYNSSTINDYFVDPANGDYHLKPGSLAIGAGDNQYVEQPQSAKDLDGHARIQGTHVDIGCYEYTPVTLDAPTVQITNPTESSATIALPTLPSGAVKYVLEYDVASDFATATSVDVTGTTFTVTGLQGTIYFRAKVIGNGESTFDSPWGTVVSRYFGTVAPVIIGVDTANPLSMVVGTATNLTSGVSVSDDVDTDLQVYYYVVDGDGEYVYDEDENYVSIDADQIPVGTYTIKYFAIDRSGNQSQYVNRTLNVVPPTLATPNVTAIATGTRRVTLYGLANANAYSWKLRYATSSAGLESATEKTLVLDQSTAVVDGLTSGTAYYIQVKAVGDGQTWATSAWSNTVQVTTLSPTTAGDADIFRIVQNTFPVCPVNTSSSMAFMARIQNAENDSVINPSQIESAVFVLYRNGIAINGFNGISVPVDCFKSSIVKNNRLWNIDNIGYNFCYVPNQTVKWMLSEPGNYTAEIVVNVDGRNPVKMQYFLNVVGDERK